MTDPISCAPTNGSRLGAFAPGYVDSMIYEFRV